MSDASTYHVQVKDEHGDLSAEETFPVGQWQKIAYWLDENGFIEEGYVIETRIIEEKATPASRACGEAVVTSEGGFFCWLPKGHDGEHGVACGVLFGDSFGDACRCTLERGHAGSHLDQNAAAQR